jgi:ABC-type sugar transport system ATPase subunit
VAYDHLNPPQAKKLGIQVIYQDLSLFPNLSVLENIAIDHELDGTLALIDTLLAVMAVKRYATTIHQLSRVFLQRDLK